MSAAIRTQTATVGDDVQLAFVDSWDGRSDLPATYTTVIGLHGVGFNSAIWTPLFAHLPADVRFVGYNQRSYAGSSPAAPADKEGGTDATAAYLGDLLGFVEFVVRELGVPGIGPDGKGGVALLGWSKGTVLPLSLLLAASAPTIPSSPTSFLSSLPPSLLSDHPTVSTHLHSLLLFEPPGSALGRPPTADYTSAMAAVSPPHSATPTQFATAFAGWIAGYSPAPEAEGVHAVGLAPSELADLEAAVGEGAWQAECVATGFGWKLAAGAGEVGELAKEAFTAPAWPVGLIYGGRTNGYCLDAAATIQEWWAEAEGGTKGTGAKHAVRRIERTNHFGQVHKPAEFVAAIIGLLEELTLKR